jgi:c-di-GMP-binding flagellar brake protein YcgR
MSGQGTPLLVRKVPYAETALVEGTEAVLWRATDEEAANIEEMPDPSQGVVAVLSWVRTTVLRFALRPPPQPVPDLVLVSTLAVTGPARFVAHRSYQIGNTVVCAPPEELYIFERRDLFRLPVAVHVAVESSSGTWNTYSIDCSLGGLRVRIPGSLEVGTEVKLRVQLGTDEAVALQAVVRHCRPFEEHAIAGLQFTGLGSEAERRLAQFVGCHQRRLLPRVRAVVPVEYRSEKERRFREGAASELSPGDVIFVAHEAHLPGEHLALQLRLRHHLYTFGALVVSSESARDKDGARRRHIVRASLDDVSQDLQGQFRRAVRDLALDRVSAG